MRRLIGLFFCTLAAVCFIIQTASQSRAALEGSGKENWRLVGESLISGGDTSTKITVTGNSVLVPVTLVYRGNQTEVQLLLDTGASVTMINTEIAERLDMNVESAQKTKVQVVGGQFIDARVVTLNSLTIGPHTKKDTRITVIPHTGLRVMHDGLLGMDVLRGFKYKVDLDKQLILWE